MHMFDIGVGPNRLLPGTKTPTLVRAGQGPFYDGMLVHFPDMYPTESGDSSLGGGALIDRSQRFRAAHRARLPPECQMVGLHGIRRLLRARDHELHVVRHVANLVARVTPPTNTETLTVPIGNPFRERRRRYDAVLELGRKLPSGDHDVLCRGQPICARRSGGVDAERAAATERLARTRGGLPR